MVLSRDISLVIDNGPVENKKVNAIAPELSNSTNYVSPLTNVNGAIPSYDNAANGTKWDNITDDAAPISTWTGTSKWEANADWNKCMPTLKKEDTNPFQSSTPQPYVFKETTPISIGTAAELAAINTNAAHLAGSYC